MFRQAFDLARVAHTVLIDVAPHPKLGKLRIVRVQHTVMVAIICGGETFKVSVIRIIGRQGKRQLHRLQDQAVTIEVDRQEPITITDPAMTRFMMTLDDAVDLVLYTFEHANYGDK